MLLIFRQFPEYFNQGGSGQGQLKFSEEFSLYKYILPYSLAGIWKYCIYNIYSNEAS